MSELKKKNLLKVYSLMLIREAFKKTQNKKNVFFWHKMPILVTKKVSRQGFVTAVFGSMRYLGVHPPDVF